MLLCSYDSDRDKFLGVEDLKKMMKKINSPPLDPSDMAEMIREVDEDGDGKLSLREAGLPINTIPYRQSDTMTQEAVALAYAEGVGSSNSAGLRRVRGVRPNRAADFRGPPFWTLKIPYKLTFILPLIEMLTKRTIEMLQPDAFCEHTMQQSATAQDPAGEAYILTPKFYTF